MREVFTVALGRLAHRARVSHDDATYGSEP